MKLRPSPLLLAPVRRLAGGFASFGLSLAGGLENRRIAALIAAYIAAFGEHASKLAPGEVGTILVLAASKLQAQTVFSYIRSFFKSSPLLGQLVEEMTADNSAAWPCGHQCSHRTTIAPSAAAPYWPPFLTKLASGVTSYRLRLMLRPTARFYRRWRRRKDVGFDIEPVCAAWFALHEAPRLFWSA